MRHLLVNAVAFFVLAGTISAQRNLSPKIIAHRPRVAKTMSHKPGSGGPDPSNGMMITTPATATQLAMAMIGSGVTLSGTPTLFGAPAQAGTFTGAPSLMGFSSGIVLSSGNVADAASTYVGPDLPSTDESSAAGGNGGLGYAPLNALIGGQATNDAAVLQFSFIPTTSTIYFTYTFASAEYPTYIGSYNDPMGLFVNGTAASNNVAVLPGTNIPVTINNVNGATNSSFFNQYNSSGSALPYGGETKALTATVNVNPGVVNTITLAVADALDHVLDTAVFLQSGSLSTAPPTPTPTPTPTPVPPALPLAMLGLAALALYVAFTQRKARA